MSMSLNLRQAIIQKVQHQPTNKLTEMIEGSIDHDEHALPGLGVLFEMIWKKSNADIRQQLIHTLQTSLENK